MAIVQQNTYGATSNLNNVCDNIFLNILGDDKIEISIDYDTTPATITVLTGSMFEYEGIRLIIDADTSFQMTNATDNYIQYDGTEFSSTSSIGTWDTEKQGYYTSGNRILKFYIDQTGKSHYDLIDFKTVLSPKTERFDKMRITLSTATNSTGVLQLDTVVFDDLSSFDTGNYRFVAPEAGYYLITFNVWLFDTYGGVNTPGVDGTIRKNGSTSLALFSVGNAAGLTTEENRTNATTLEYLEKDDYIDIYINALGSAYDWISTGTTKTYFEVFRLL